MQLKRPLPNLGDLGVVDLDLVGRVRRDRSSGEQNCRNRKASSETVSILTLINTRGVTLCCLPNAHAWLRHDHTG